MLGAEGRQFLCWTNEAADYTAPKAPGGGGFGCEVITLEWLYQEFLAHHNTWSRTNQYKDLCRYTGCTITLFRHPNIDFIFQYNIQPPFQITKLTYPDIQPQNMLLQPHHRIILSRQSKPNGKLRVRVKIKPPKQMTTRWFFQKEFSEAVLVQLKAVACTFTFPRIAPKAQSQLITLYYVNENFYPSPSWGQVHSGGYIPIATKKGVWKFFKKAGDKLPSLEIDTNKFPQGEQGYYKSINWSGGFFDTKVLTAARVTYQDAEVGSLPIFAARYNPNTDTGQGNTVYAVSILQHSYDPPQIQSDYVIRGQPLWMAFHGFWNWIKYASKDKAFYTHYAFMVKSPAIHPISQTSQQRRYLLLDPSFIAGKLPFDEYLDDNQKKLWYPKAQYQTETINALVESGPFIPRLTNIAESTWELSYKYTFHFKWGGPQITDRPVDDPQYQADYPVPGNHQHTVQVSDPQTLATESLLHEWDFRRGIVTHTALKRMSENFESETDICSDASGTPTKKRKVSKELPYQQPQEETIKACLQALCKENTCQETPQTFEELIQQQQQQQQQLKNNILQLLTKLKKDQRFLGLQTGLLE